MIMKNMPSFSEFKKYDDLLESADPNLVAELRNLETADTEYPVNEGYLTNSIKNSLSKFLLGSFSSLHMIDEARNIILQLKLDMIKKRDQFEKELNKLDDDIDVAANAGQKDKIDAIAKERENKQAEMEKYMEAQELKVKKSEDVATKLVNNKERRRQYLEAGYADDEIKIAELEYKLAKSKSKSGVALKAYEDRLAKAKAHAEAQAQALKQAGLGSGSSGATGASSKTTTSKTAPTHVVWVIDGKVEKKKYATKKAKAVLKRRDEVEQDIADIKLAIAKKLDLLVGKVNKSATPVTSKYLSSVKTRLLNLTAGLDARVNLLRLFRSLGKTETEMQLKLDDPAIYSKFMDKVEVSIHDGKDIRTGKSKVITDLFDRAASDPASVSISKIDDAKLKLNK
jgi:hypothetical protein